MEKYSFIGLSLLTVSAITAAFIPSKTSRSSTAINGIMDNSTGKLCNLPDPTCRERVAGDSPANCSFTDTGAGALSSTDGPSDCSHSYSLVGSNTESVTTEAGID